MSGTNGERRNQRRHARPRLDAVAAPSNAGLRVDDGPGRTGRWPCWRRAGQERSWWNHPTTSTVSTVIQAATHPFDRVDKIDGPREGAASGSSQSRASTNAPVVGHTERGPHELNDLRAAQSDQQPGRILWNVDGARRVTPRPRWTHADHGSSRSPRLLDSERHAWRELGLGWVRARCRGSGRSGYAFDEHKLVIGAADRTARIVISAVTSRRSVARCRSTQVGLRLDQEGRTIRGDRRIDVTPRTAVSVDNIERLGASTEPPRVLDRFAALEWAIDTANPVAPVLKDSQGWRTTSGNFFHGGDRAETKMLAVVGTVRGRAGLAPSTRRQSPGARRPLRSTHRACRPGGENDRPRSGQ